MRAKSYRGAWLMAAWLALSPGVLWGQDATGYAPAHPQLPIPTGSTRPEDGGLFLATGGILWSQDNPLKQQLVAVRGFRVLDHSVPRVAPGTFFGSGAPALDVNQLTGQDSYQPGLFASIGWKFRDKSSLTLTWTYLSTAQYRAGATLLPQNGAVGINLVNTFLYSDVFNIPPEYAGPPNKLQPQATITIPGLQPNTFLSPSETALFGIWNGASIMTESFRQRFQQWELTYRWEVWDTEDYRFSGLVGPKFAWFWEKFKWETTSIGHDSAGNAVAGPDDVGIYTNITSNRMYGVFVGCQNECYLGHGFAVMLDTRASLFINSVKERAKYETANRFQGLPENKRAKREFTVVPELEAHLGLTWYPTETIQVYFGYDVLFFFNTLASRRPIDFDYSNLAPKWSSYTRMMDGFMGGFSIHF